MISTLLKPTIALGDKKYKVINQIGEGGFAFVYHIMSVNKDDKKESYALKKMICQTEEQLEEAKKEIRIMNSIKHENLLPLIDSSMHLNKKNQTEVMLLLPLYEKTVQTEIDQGRGYPYCAFKDTLDVITIMRACVSGLSAMHSCGVRHADFKPANILLNADNSSVVITDFGSAAEIPCVVSNRAEALLQEELASVHTTAPYRAPELFNCPSHCTLNTEPDVWALGCSMYAMMFSRSPFETAAEGFSSLAVLSAQLSFPAATATNNWPQMYKDVIIDCLTLDPAMRPQLPILQKRLQSMPYPPTQDSPVVDSSRNIDSPNSTASTPRGRGPSQQQQTTATMPPPIPPSATTPQPHNNSGSNGAANTMHTSPDPQQQLQQQQQQQQHHRISFIATNFADFADAFGDASSGESTASHNNNNYNNNNNNSCNAAGGPDLSQNSSNVWQSEDTSSWSNFESSHNNSEINLSSSNHHNSTSSHQFSFPTTSSNSPAPSTTATVSTSLLINATGGVITEESFDVLNVLHHTNGVDLHIRATTTLDTVDTNDTDGSGLIVTAPVTPISTIAISEEGAGDNVAMGTTANVGGLTTTAAVATAEAAREVGGIAAALEPNVGLDAIQVDQQNSVGAGVGAGAGAASGAVEVETGDVSFGEFVFAESLQAAAAVTVLTVSSVSPAHNDTDNSNCNNAPEGASFQEIEDDSEDEFGEFSSPAPATAAPEEDGADKIVIVAASNNKNSGHEEDPAVKSEVFSGTDAYVANGKIRGIGNFNDSAGISGSGIGIGIGTDSSSSGNKVLQLEPIDLCKVILHQATHEAVVKSGPAYMMRMGGFPKKLSKKTIWLILTPAGLVIQKDSKVGSKVHFLLSMHRPLSLTPSDTLSIGLNGLIIQGSQPLPLDAASGSPIRDNKHQYPNISGSNSNSSTSAQPSSRSKGKEATDAWRLNGQHTSSSDINSLDEWEQVVTPNAVLDDNFSQCSEPSDFAQQQQHQQLAPKMFRSIFRSLRFEVSFDSKDEMNSWMDAIQAQRDMYTL